MLAFLDCGLRYEPVNHTLAGTRAIGSGLAVMVANSAFDIYGGQRAM